VRAPGLEPGLVRGKSPVPYQSGVTRVVGREGIEPPVSIDGCQQKKYSRTVAPHGATDPLVAGTGCDAGPDDDVSDAVVKVLLAELDARRVGRPGRSRTLGRRFWRRGTTLARAFANNDDSIGRA
jgi:hypothetical protein